MLARVLAVINTDQVVALIFNSQSTAPVSDQIIGNSCDRDIPVAGISHSAGRLDYPSSMDETITNLADAVAADPHPVPFSGKTGPWPRGRV